MGHNGIYEHPSNPCLTIRCVHDQVKNERFVDVIRKHTSEPDEGIGVVRHRAKNVVGMPEHMSDSFDGASFFGLLGASHFSQPAVLQYGEKQDDVCDEGNDPVSDCAQNARMDDDGAAGNPSHIQDDGHRGFETIDGMAKGVAK